MAGEKILIVEDNSMNLELATDLLEAAGYFVIQARSAEEGLKLASADSPDLILMDIGLPGMDGLKATRVLKQDLAITDIPVIALTAHAMQGDEEKALASGCTGYITKPIDTRTFSKTVFQFIDSARRLTGMKILIVDDLEVNLELLEARLEGNGYDVTIARNGIEALEILKTDSFDMIISDILMPKMDGYQLCRECKKDNALRKIPFVFYTATYRDKKDEEFALSLGAERFIVKPTGNKSFMEIIEGVLKNHKKGLLTFSEIPVEEEDIYLKEYNERLINKLEKKMLDLEREINQRKLTEEKLQFERNKVVNILESMADGIYIVNRQYDIEYANPVLKKEFGAAEGKCYEYLHDRKEACPWCKNQEVFAGKTVRWEWYSFKNQKTYDLIDTPLKNSDGSISKLEIFRDVTDRKQAKEALQESERRLKQAVEGISIPTFIIDNNHKLTHWNKACESLTGFSASEVVGTKKQWLAFYSEERPIMADFIVNGVTEEKIASYYKVVNYNKSVLIEGAYEGEDFYPALGEKGKWLFFTAAPLRDQQRKIVGAIQTFQDITERRSIEAQLRQSQKMEAIGILAGGVAHDFNNLLTVIIGNAQLALMKIIKDESLRKEIEEIKKAGEKAASLTRQLLAFSRKQIVQPRILDINELLTDIEKMLGRLIGENIELLTIPAPALWRVEIDPGQIEQVIMNLAINAKDAMSTCADSAAGRPPGGKLIIETANADLDKNYFRERDIHEEKPGHYVMLSISDTGCGMDKKTREHIFEPFFTTKEVGKGTGLGLSTVYGIVKQNNGFIWVYSEPGKGTTFKVYLPKVKDVEPKEKEQTPVDDLGGSETVLIVEDDDNLRKFAQKALRQHGYKLLVAENGEDALKVCKEYDGQIDLMITDVVMPKMGGRETADRLQPLYSQMKVIYMSGYTNNAIVRHGVLAPELNFLEKPFTPKGLAREVRETLDNLRFKIEY